MDGMESEIFQYFKSLLIRGFIEIRKHIDDLLILVEILMKGTIYYVFSVYEIYLIDSTMGCFVRPKTVCQEIREPYKLEV